MKRKASARIKLSKVFEGAVLVLFPGWLHTGQHQAGEARGQLCWQSRALGKNKEKAKQGFADFPLLDNSGFPLIVLEAKAEDKALLIGKEQARKYARSQNYRFCYPHQRQPALLLGFGMRETLRNHIIRGAGFGCPIQAG